MKRYRYGQLLVIMSIFKNSCQEPPNLGLAKQKVSAYFNSGRYRDQIDMIGTQIQEWVERHAPYANHQAIVFDFDDTLVSTWPETEKNDFGYNSEIAAAWAEKRFFALKPIQKAYEAARQAGLTIVIITARSEQMRPAVLENLQYAGYSGWHQLILRPASFDNRSRKCFKTHCRKELERSGMQIMINVGDQISDLAGGHAEKRFKLPNPAYFVH